MKAATCLKPGCARRPQPKRRVCDCCRQRAYRAAHPIRYAWHDLRHHANERRIAVGLTWEEFEYFSLATGYHERRGNAPDALTIDRYDAEQGYEATNINILPRAENSRKWWEYDRPRRLATMERRAA